MADRQFQVVGDVEVSVPATYPLNKETAEIFLDMTRHPGWLIFLQCVEYEANLYKDVMLNTGYGPHALEKMRFHQALATNLPRIPRAIIEAANSVLDDGNTLDSIYDALHLEE